MIPGGLGPHFFVSLLVTSSSKRSAKVSLGSQGILVVNFLSKGGSEIWLWGLPGSFYATEGDFTFIVISLVFEQFFAVPSGYVDHSVSSSIVYTADSTSGL